MLKLAVLQSAGRNLWPLAKFGAARIMGRKFPLMVTLSITDRCNFRCVYCELPALDREEMDTQGWLRAIDELHAAGMRRASIMGGEPLVRKDAGVLVDRLKALDVNVAMNTNGWMVPDRIDELAKLDLMCVTVDGPPEVHDVQRHPKSQERALRAIEIAKGRGINVVTMTVLTARSIDHVDHVLAVGRDLGVRCFFQLEHDSWGDPDKEIGKNITDEQIADVARHLLRRKQEGWPVGVSRTFLKALAGDGDRGVRRLDSCSDCQASRYFLAITPQGDVIPCPLTYRQRPRLSGAELGFARAFQQLEQPTNAGCSCYPTQELNNLLRFQPESILNLFDSTL